MLIWLTVGSASSEKPEDKEYKNITIFFIIKGLEIQKSKRKIYSYFSDKGF